MKFSKTISFKKVGASGDDITIGVSDVESDNAVVGFEKCNQIIEQEFVNSTYFGQTKQRKKLSI